MLASIARDIEAFLRDGIILPCRPDFDVEELVAAFYQDYLEISARVIPGGSGFHNLLGLCSISRAMDLRLLIDSGTFTGMSAWALGRGSPEAALHSFDIDLSQLSLRTEQAHYHEMDWTGFDFGNADPEHSLCYFDDHVDQVRRILEAHERGFRYLVFDDDASVGRMTQTAGSPIALPKLQFVFDESLEDGEEIRWLNMGRPRAFKVDRGYLEQARSRIEAIQKLPEIWTASAGMHQNPYTLVVLKPALLA
jgi:hypothetical protein